MQNVSFNIRLDSTKLKYGYRPVVLQVISNRVPRSIRLGMKAKPSEWNKSRYKNKPQYNNILDEKERLARDIYDSYFLGSKFDYQKFAELFRMGGKHSCFYEYAEKFISCQQKLKTKMYYRDCVKAMQKIRPSLSLDQLTYSLMKEYEPKYFSDAYTRGIKAIINEAIRERLVDATASPFKSLFNPSGYVFPKKKKVSRKQVALTENEIKYFLNLEEESLYKDIALFSFHAFGINMMDFIQFTDANEIEGAIDFTRSKTGIHVRVPITPEARAIIDKYREGDRWFPFCELKEQDVVRRVNNTRRKVTKWLKNRAKKGGINTDLNFYSMRHTSATLALRNGMPIEKVSALLGHASIEITMRYFAGFQIEELNEAMSKFASITKNKNNGKEKKT